MDWPSSTEVSACKYYKQLVWLHMLHHPSFYDDFALYRTILISDEIQFDVSMLARVHVGLLVQVLSTFDRWKNVLFYEFCYN